MKLKENLNYYAKCVRDTSKIKSEITIENVCGINNTNAHEIIEIIEDAIGEATIYDLRLGLR